MRITSIDCHVLVEPDFDPTAASSAQDDFVVEIHTDEGISGVGESDVNPWIARACIESPGTHNMGLGLADMLIGRDPLDIANVMRDLYMGSAMNGRRGAVVHALGAIDIALHDIAGKYLGKPVHELLGPVARERIVPYASLQPEVSSYDEYRDSIAQWAVRARDFGFTAMKTEVTLAGPYAHKGLRESWERSTEVIAGVRAAVGYDVALMVDVQYAFPDADTAIGVLRDWEQFQLTFVEAPLWPDDLAGYSRLRDEQGVPIAAGEWLATRYEFEDLIDRGRVHVAQPDLGRVGGLVEAMHVARYAADRSTRIVPHLWKTGISIAAATHFAAVASTCEYIEFLPRHLSESELRKYLTGSDPIMVDGMLSLPTAPGLGVEINRDALHHYSEIAAREVHQGV